MWQRMQDHLRREFAQWSPTLFLLDGGINAVAAAVFAGLMKMDTGWLIIAFLGTVIATTAAISLIRQSIADRSSGLSDNTLAEMERSNRLHHVDRQIWELVDDLTITWPQTELPEDWKTKCKATLRAILKPEIVDDFDKCLKTQFPRESARAFLRALAGSLTLADLRSGA